jgi:1,4-alpha-glucan branching enzyme
MRPHRIVSALLALLVAASTAPGAPRAAGLDGAIDVAHVSHVAWQDRRPLCPVDQQAFVVRLYAPAGDLSGVRVRRVEAAGTWVTAARTGVRGPYDVWQATLPAATQPQVRYYFELSDGAARAFAGPAGVGAAAPADSGWLVDFATLSHAPYGATPVTGGGVVFRVWAPHPDSAAVRGEFNGWGVTRMNRVGEDFVARVPNAGVNQQYKYFFYPNTWGIDLRGRVLDPAAFLWNSRIADPATFAWSDSGWTTPPLDRLVVYQLNVGTFSGLDDPHGATSFPARFTDLAARAHELAGLGVNAVLLNPVTSTRDLTYAGYATMTPWSPNWDYGMPDDFKSAVNALHHEGIAVLCDIVWSHVDPFNDMLWNYDGAPLYEESPATQTQWGPQAAFGRAGVDDFYAHSALHWLEEYHVDGFRMDAAGAMALDPHAPGGWALMQRFNDDLERRWRDKVRLAENFPLLGSFVTSTSLGGAGFQVEYNGEYEYTLRYAIPQPSAYWNYGYAPALFSLMGGASAGHQELNYFELHDNAWTPNHRFVRDVAPTPGVIADTARARMSVAMGLLLLTPGVPAMLMGDEWLETADWGTTAANRIDWAKRTQNAGYYAFVRDLVQLRTHLPAFRADATCYQTHGNYSDGVMGWLRTDADGRVYLLVANLGDTDFPSYLIGAPLGGTWVEVLNSQASAYGGTGRVNPGPLTAFPRQQDGYPRTLDLAVPRASVMVFQALTAADAGTDVAPAALRIDRVWPNPARGPLRVGFTLPRAGDAELAVFDPQGRRVATLLRGALPAGTREVTWDGRDAAGARAAPGVYLVRLRAATGAVTRRVALLP